MADTPVTWLAIRDDQKAFEDQQLRALRAAFPDLAEASGAQLGIFFHYCKASGLDPFGRQIYMIKRRSRGEIRWTIQTGIDGYRLIARRAADQAGQAIAYEDFVWYDAEGGEHAVWLREEPPAACKVVVWRGDARFPAVAHWREYVPKVWDYEAQDWKLGGLWPQMPASQLSKVAEALALRRACPADLSGLRVDEEMHAADAQESRERVEKAAAGLRRKTSPSRTRRTKAEDREREPVEAEIVEEPDAEADGGSEAEESGSPEADGTKPDMEQARAHLRRTARRIGMSFDDVNELCFAEYGVSVQDASAEQLGDLTIAAQAIAATDDGPEEDVLVPAAKAPGRKRAAAKKAATAKRTSRRATRSKTADEPGA